MQESFANRANFVKISCTRIFDVLQMYSSINLKRFTLVFSCWKSDGRGQISGLYYTGTRIGLLTSGSGSGQNETVETGRKFRGVFLEISAYF